MRFPANTGLPRVDADRAACTAGITGSSRVSPITSPRPAVTTADVRRTVIAMALASLVALLASAARADDADDLARAVAHEAGLDASADEVAAIWAVATSRCPGCRHPMRVQMARFFTGRTRRAPIFLALSTERLSPLLVIARQVVSGELTARCSPQAWGGLVDRERARRLRLIEVDCGETRNTFYVYPERRR